LPVALRHLAPVGTEPPDVGQPRPADLGAAQECLAPEDRMRVAQPNEPSREVVQLGRCVAVRPRVPRDLAVLAPTVVVSELGATALVAAEDHRRALRDEQGRYEVALLAGTELDHLRIVSVSLDPAVPRPVVVGAVAVVLEVRLV